MLVAFDTIFEQCSLTVLDMTGVVRYTQTMAGSRGQTEVILPMLDTAFNELGISVADVQAWAFNQGPGAFSGIRINTAVVQALSVANDAPCVGVSSLLTLADTAHQSQNFPNGTTLTALIDARQQQYYAGDFIVVDGQCAPHGENHEYLLDYDNTPQADVLISDSMVALPNIITVRPTASDIARLALGKFQNGQSVPAHQALPVYLRHNAWKTLAEQGKKPL